MGILIIAEHDNKQLHSATAATVAAGLQLNNDITLLVMGYECQTVAEQAACLMGVTKVLIADNPDYTYPLAENLAELIVNLAPDYEALLAPATTFGKNLLPRVAAKLDVTQVSDVTAIINSTTFEHPIYAGNAIETVRVLDLLLVLTIRTTAFNPVVTHTSPCAITPLQASVVKPKTKVVSQELSQSVRPELTAASIIVSGGRALQSAENFKLIEQLADVLGAAVGASRAAVDAGYIANDYQVGQTGKIVAPELYIAVGISGAVQHLAGMKDSKVIVAINKDSEAPIFQIATYGLIGDLFTLVPQLINELKQSK